MAKQVNKIRVLVGMSGGVDSSVTATLLKQAGYDVTGAFIKVWEPPDFTCTWREDRRDAMRVAAHLDIPLITVDLENEYKQGVVDYMIAEYRAGRTPNPDVMCNKTVKFGAFYDKARALGFDYVATGHYAQIKQNPNANYQLVISPDTEKDQTYFLWNIKPEQLPHILFPVGGYTKSEIRQLARKFKLPTADKKDSQGLCFIGQLDVKNFLKKFINTTPGQVLDEDGKAIGEHEGAILYTLGERHGFTVNHHGPDSGPYYVVAKDINHNTITVSTNRQANPTQASQITISQVNWISDGKPQPGQTYECRFRYRQPLIDCQFQEQSRDTWQVTLTDPSDPAPPGQSLVVYDGEVCLGGGIVM